MGKRPFPFGGRSAIVIRQDMSPHVQALLQKGVRVRRLLSIRVYWQTFQLSRDIKTVVQLKKLMQHWTEVALGSAWPSHGLTTSGINCQPMASLSNFSPGRRTVRHSSHHGLIIKPKFVICIISMSYNRKDWQYLAIFLAQAYIMGVQPTRG